MLKKLKHKASLVCRLQKPRPKSAVHFNRTIDDSTCYIVQPFLFYHLGVLCALGGK